MSRTTTDGKSKKGSSSAPGRSSRKARAAAEAQRRRRTRLVAIGAIAAVLVLVVAMVIVSLTRETAPSQGAGEAGTAADLVQQVPAGVLNAVGPGTGVTPPTPLPAGTPALEEGGKPEVLYVGAEYCPFCAAQRWPVVVALSRFGSFTNLRGTESAAADVHPRTQTFTFDGATYASDVLSFTGVETQTNQPDPAGGYTPLQQLTAEQQQLLTAYDRAPYTESPGAIPFLMIGNRYVAIGASFDPSVLDGMTREEIAQALSDPSSPIAQGVNGSANAMTAAICELTGGTPASVCSDPAIRKLAAQNPGA